MSLPKISSVVLKPNIGAVVNQNQGFVLDVTVDNTTGAVDAHDVVLEVTSVSAGIVVGVGINVPINLPTIPKGTSHTIPVVFETEDGITIGNKTIKLEAKGYFGGPEWLVVHTGGVGGFVYDEGLHDVFPKWSDTHTETVQIHPE